MPPPSLSNRTNTRLNLRPQTSLKAQATKLVEDIFISLAGTMTVIGIGYLLYRLVATLIA